MRGRLPLLLLVVLFSASCGDDSSPTSPSRPDPVPSGPTISCPAGVNATTTTTTAQVAYAAPVVSGGTQPVSVACTPASGSNFPLGSTNVTCTATDAASRQATCSFPV